MTQVLRAAVLAGAACLFSAAWQTIDCAPPLPTTLAPRLTLCPADRHRLQQESEEFTRPQSEALAVLLAGVLLCTYGEPAAPPRRSRPVALTHVRRWAWPARHIRAHQPAENPAVRSPAVASQPAPLCAHSARTGTRRHSSSGPRSCAWAEGDSKGSLAGESASRGQLRSSSTP